jgi:hypothetical protein
MKCLVCGGEMHVMMVEPHDSAGMRGFEHRTLQCNDCADIERRFVFDSQQTLLPISIAPEHPEAPQLTEEAKSVFDDPPLHIAYHENT